MLEQSRRISPTLFYNSSVTTSNNLTDVIKTHTKIITAVINISIELRDAQAFYYFCFIPI